MKKHPVMSAGWGLIKKKGEGMKNAVIGFFMIVILVISLAAIQTAENRTTRKNELDSSLSEAMEQSMKILTVNPVYHIEKEAGSDEFTADFIQGFLMKTTSNSEFTVEILNVDVEKGLLDVRAKARFRQIIGYGEVSCRKTVILEELEEEKETPCYISFFAEKPAKETDTESSYVLKKISVHFGDRLSAAMLPESGLEKKGYIFRGWKMTKPVNGIGILYGNENINTLCVGDDMEFQAVYEQEEVL